MAPLHLFDQHRGVDGPDEVFRYVDTKNLEAGHTQVEGEYGYSSLSI